MVVLLIFDRGFPYITALYICHRTPILVEKTLEIRARIIAFGRLEKKLADSRTNPPLCLPYLYVVGTRRRVSMATASALEGLGPMERRDSKVGMMIKMFKSPDTHAPYLTASRFAHDLITVGPWKAFLRERYCCSTFRGLKYFWLIGASENSPKHCRCSLVPPWHASVSFSVG